MVYVAQIHADLTARYFGVFAGMEPTTSGLTIPRSDQLCNFYIVSDVYIHIVIWVFGFWFVMPPPLFIFIFCFLFLAATQIALQVQQEHTRVVCSNKEARKRLTESNNTPAMDLGHMNVVLK